MSIFTQRGMANSASSRGLHASNGSLATFASSVWSPSAGSVGRREESYHLLLELCSQEPTMQCCFKIIESTCLARGIDMEIGGKSPSQEFRAFVSRYYLPFAENALRYFFALGFVPWRLRKLSTGDVVPETIPLGLFTWSIESIPNRVARMAGSHRVSSSSGHGGASTIPGGNRQKNGQFAAPGSKTSSSSSSSSSGMDKYQAAAEMSFQKQKAYFSDPKRVPYPLQGDVMRMPNRSDSTKKAENERLQGFSSEQRKRKLEEGGTEDGGVAPDGFAASSSNQQGKPPSSNTPAFYRQRAALQRQAPPPDDDDTKMLR